MGKLSITKGDLKVRLYEMKNITGEASVTIRKQKQIFLYDFEMELYFDAIKVSDPNVSCKGKVKIHEFNQDDDELTIDFNCDDKQDFVPDVKRIINNEMIELAIKTIQSLGNAMRD